MEISRRTLIAGTAVLTAVPYLAAEALADEVAKSEMPAEGVVLVAIVKAKAGEEAAVEKAVRAMVEPTRKEAGCLCYNLHQSKSDKAQFMFYEQWASQEALDAHSKSAHMKALVAALAGRTEPGGVTAYQLLK